MKKEELYKICKIEEEKAIIKGWDFSYIKGKYEQDKLPWNYKEIVFNYLKDEMQLLDIDTGGGEFLLSLNHPFKNTSVTENYDPNLEICNKKLKPLGINVKKADAFISLPFEDESFDIVINRHGAFNPKEIYRVLKDNGLFISEQVGTLNDLELINLLIKNYKSKYPRQHLNIIKNDFINEGFEILKGLETFKDIAFFDIGALVWFAKVLPWEFLNFSVDSCFDNLCKANEILEKNGKIKGSIHRILIVTRKCYKSKL